MNACLEKMLPVVTAHALLIQDAYNSLLDSLAAVEEAGSDDEVTENCEFVLAELLRLALNLDYADEIRRRRLEQFVRMCRVSVLVTSFCFSAVLAGQMISQEAFPSVLVTRCLNILFYAPCPPASVILSVSSSKSCMSSVMQMTTMKLLSVLLPALHRSAFLASGPVE